MTDKVFLVIGVVLILSFAYLVFKSRRRINAVNASIKKTNDYIEENTQRLNLLSLENARLIEENRCLKEKLKNLGFTEIDLK